jgi:ribosomal protein L2
MNTIELRLEEVLELQIELEGYTNPQNGETLVKGFINHSLPLTTKFWLSKIVSRVTNEKKEIEKIRTSLIEKLGEKDEQGGISIDQFIKNNEINPNFVKFQEEYQALLKEVITIEYNPIPLDSLKEIKTEDNYNILFKLVSE